MNESQRATTPMAQFWVINRHGVRYLVALGNSWSITGGHVLRVL